MLQADKKQMDARRKDGLKKLKARLASITESEEMNAEAKLQYLYDTEQLDEYMRTLLQAK